MNIAKIQQLNSMAKELQKHNIVGSQEAAIKHAEEIFGSENSYSRERLQTSQAEIHDLRKQVRKLNFALQYAMKEITELQSNYSVLNKNIKHVPHETSNSLESAKTRSAVPRSLATNKPQNDLNVPIDRNKVAPAEVSIEKYFYFGQK